MNDMVDVTVNGERRALESSRSSHRAGPSARERGTPFAASLRADQASPESPSRSRTSQVQGTKPRRAEELT